MENIENSSVFQAEIKAILAYKAKDGATYLEVKEEYAALVGRDLCFDTEKQFNAFMRTMPDVHPVKMPDGHFAWFSSSDKSKHIAQLVTNQKPSREFPVRKSIRKESKYNSGTTCFYNDNYAYKNRRFTDKIYRRNAFSTEMKYARKASSFYNYDLVGDDFFLNVANIDCRHKLEFVYPAENSKGRSIKVCGLCISGQTIQRVTDMVKCGAKMKDQIILNIGSVDLLHRRSFAEMQSDFYKLYAELENRGIHTVITTVAPLGNMLYSQEIQERWQQFNMFLLREFPNVIDITPCFVTDSNRILFECYQQTPKYVTGSTQAHLMWNYVGRQRVLKELKTNLATFSFENSFLRS